VATNSISDLNTVSNNLPPFQPKDKPEKWTVMVFMGAGQVPGAASLTTHADQDMREMSSVGSDGPHGRLNIFVQRHGDGVPRREWIGVNDPDNGQVPDDEATTAEGHALKRFMIWALKKAQHGPTDASVLILWGHAYHFAIGHTTTPTGIEALDFGELKTVFSQFQSAVLAELQKAWQEHGILVPPGANRLDILGFDACDLAAVEVANHLNPFAKYLVASQIGIPLPGWPYKNILGRLKDAVGPRRMSAAEFGSFAVREFCLHYNERREPLPVSLTLLDLQKSERVFEVTERLAAHLALAGGTDSRELALIREQFARSQTVTGRPFIDVATFCLNLSRHSNYPGVRGAAAALGDLLIRPATNGNGDETARRSFIVEHSRNSHATAGLQGVSLYAPQIVSTDWREPRFFYTKFASTKESAWSRLVHALAEGN
jgi:Clostripain family